VISFEAGLTRGPADQNVSIPHLFQDDYSYASCQLQSLPSLARVEQLIGFRKALRILANLPKLTVIQSCPGFWHRDDAGLERINTKGQGLLPMTGGKSDLISG
jgi:hypothetical protein